MLTKTGTTFAFQDFLIDATPEILWFWCDSDDDYQGQVYALGYWKNNIVWFSGYYGSCSGCGAWGEGGEPTNLDEVLADSAVFRSTTLATQFIRKANEYFFNRAVEKGAFKSLDEHIRQTNKS